MNLTANALSPRQQGEHILDIDFLQVKKASLILRALNHNLRQQMLKLLADQLRLTVTEIYVHLRLEQSVASQHLAILRRSGIVKTTRSGKLIYYEIDHNRVSKIQNIVEELLH